MELPIEMLCLLSSEYLYVMFLASSVKNDNIKINSRNGSDLPILHVEKGRKMLRYKITYNKTT